MPDYETFEHDVLVIGAGGAGLRAAIEACNSFNFLTSLWALL